jgi:hypothetical protein
MPKKLLGMIIDEISAVSEPATGKRFLIIKNTQAASEALNRKRITMPETQTTNTYEFIQKLAKQRIAWGENETMAEAIQDVVKAHPDLYQRYLGEQQEELQKAQHQRKYASASAWNTIETRAKDMVAKGQAPTMAQAVASVVQDEPGLYSTYCTGMPNHEK